jgi:hypothetical protein
MDDTVGVMILILFLSMLSLKKTVTGKEYLILVLTIIIGRAAIAQSVSIATGYGLDDQGVGVRVPAGGRIFSSSCRPDRLWGSLSLLWVARVKRPGHEADHSPPTSAEVKKTWVCTSTPHTSSWCSA